MSGRLRVRTTRARTSQPRIGAGLLPVPGTEQQEPCSSPSILSPFHMVFALQAEGNDAELQRAWFPQVLLLQPKKRQAKRDRASAVWLDRHPERDAALQTGVFVKRHLSPYFPCLPSVTRFGAYPAPVGTRRSASSYGRPPGLGFQTKNLPAASALRARFFLWSLRRKSRLRPWERGTSRRFAQECPEGNPGKYKRGETQWHSTKTKSL